MGLPLYKSPSSEALRRQAEAQVAAQTAARRAEAAQAAANPRRARSGAPSAAPPPLRREDAQRRPFSGSSSRASSGSQQRPIDLTEDSPESQSRRHSAQRRPAPPPPSEVPLPSTEDEEMLDIDDATSAAMSRYRRTDLDNSELATPAEEEEIRLPNYGTPDVDWSTPEIDAASTPPRGARSSPPRAVRSSPPVPASAPQPQRRQQAPAGPSQVRQGQDSGHISGGRGGGRGGSRGGFVQLVMDQTRGPVVQVQGNEQALPIPPSLILPPPRPSDATIRDPRRRRLAQRGASSQTSGSRQPSGSSGNREPNGGGGGQSSSGR